ncbi:MAG: helix-turn-helix domain-containing protein [bacterium]
MKTKPKRKKVDASPKNTQDKILHAATKVFADHGYRDATTRMICSEARVNVALVNYYFRSKAELYKAVIGALFEDVAKPMMSIPDTVCDEATWKRAVRMWIRRSLAICAARQPPEFWLARLMGMEQCVPSAMAQDIEHKFAIPMRHCFARLIRMAMPHDDPVQISLWHSTVLAQSVVYAIAKPSWAARFCPPELDREAWLDQVADHICGGIFSRLSFQRKIDG